MKMKLKMGIVLISIILLSATAFAAPIPAKTTPAEKLKASFTVTYDKKMPLTVKLTDKSKGKPDKWAWNFGDKSKIIKTKNAMHTYKKAGTYTVTLTVMKGKEKSKATMKITVPKKKMTTPTKM